MGAPNPQVQQLPHLAPLPTDPRPHKAQQTVLPRTHASSSPPTAHNPQTRTTTVTANRNHVTREEDTPSPHPNIMLGSLSTRDTSEHSQPKTVTSLIRRQTRPTHQPIRLTQLHRKVRRPVQHHIGKHMRRARSTRTSRIRSRQMSEEERRRRHTHTPPNNRHTQQRADKQQERRTTQTRATPQTTPNHTSHTTTRRNTPTPHGSGCCWGFCVCFVGVCGLFVGVLVLERLGCPEGGGLGLVWLPSGARGGGGAGRGCPGGDGPLYRGADRSLTVRCGPRRRSGWLRASERQRAARGLTT
jgi:hypothetical protein